MADRGWTAAYGEWGAPPSQWGLLRHQDQLYKKWQREQPEEVARLEALTAGVVREAEMRARMRIPPEYVRLHVSCAAPLHATWRLRIARTLTGGVGDDLSGGRPPERYRLVSEQLAFALSRTHAGRVDAKLGAGPVSIGVLSLASPDERRRRAESNRQLDGLRVAERRRAVAPPLPASRRCSRCSFTPARFYIHSAALSPPHSCTPRATSDSQVQQLLSERRGLFSVHCTIEPSPWWQSAQPRISLRYARELAIGTSDGEGFRTVVPHGEADDARAFAPLPLPPPPAAAAASAYGPYARGAPPARSRAGNPEMPAASTAPPRRRRRCDAGERDRTLSPHSLCGDATRRRRRLRRRRRRPPPPIRTLRRTLRARCQGSRRRRRRDDDDGAGRRARRRRAARRRRVAALPPRRSGSCSAPSPATAASAAAARRRAATATATAAAASA